MVVDEEKVQTCAAQEQRTETREQRTETVEQRTETVEKSNRKGDTGLEQLIGVRGRKKEDGRQGTDHVRQGAEDGGQGTET